MKKTYLQPALAVTAMEQSLPIAASLKINSEPVNSITGDAKGADWDIWGEAEEAE